MVLVVVLLALPHGVAEANKDAVQAPVGREISAPSAEHFLGEGGSAGASHHRAVMGAPAADYQVVFECNGQERTRLRDSLVCPAHILDQHDAMSQPVLLIDPLSPYMVGFNALHGGHGDRTGPVDDAPSKHSRDNAIHQPHTTFRSTDGGSTWHDMPYYAPQSLAREGRSIFGEDNAATLDAEGRTYLASVYAYREAPASAFAAPEPFRYALGLWKQPPLYSAFVYDTNILVHHAGNEGANRIHDIHTAYASDADQVFVFWLETAPGEGESDAAPDPSEASDENGTGLRILMTDPAEGARWTTIAHTGLPGSCLSLTRPFHVAGELYFGCVPGTDYVFPTNSTGGLQVHAFDPTTLTIRHVASTGVAGNEPVLIPRGIGGHMVALSGHLEDGAPRLWVAYGDADHRWSDVRDRVDDVTLQGTGIRIADARVTAAAYRDDSGHIHLIYMERFQTEGTVEGQEGQAQYYKAFVSIRGEEDVRQVIDLEMGQLTRLDLSANRNGVGLDVYEDQHDDIVVWTDMDTGQQREYVAFGDHGYIRFGEVTEENAAPPPILIGPQVAPVPLATAGANPLVLGMAAGSLSGAMVARFLAMRKKSTVEVEVGS